ncbi:unnamed protein product [Schistocephalus solidus]|uniref:Methylmalonic aciduria type A protein n=1 Tax=Schistocephalus solidus TaxID=70667 RepID=A0A183SJ92_SCHSO|nr:unnamed protein product [Schistocephalus solidus]
MQSVRLLPLSGRSFSSHALLLRHSVRCVNTNVFFGKVDKDAAAEAAKPFLEKLLQGDRSTLAKSITLVESLRPDKRAQGQAILAGVMQHMNSLLDTHDPAKTTFRVGLSGPPGAGKSTLIEALGCRLTGHVPWDSTNADLESMGLKQMSNSSEPKDAPKQAHRKHKVAVLAVDPSSSTSGGSLLADKTRMQYLAQDLNAFIRPSPNSGYLGGVARATNETVVLCEGCGYDTVLVETVGVGQAEFKVADMVDIFVLVIPPAGGDELQGMKRGIVEVADLIVINKADGDLLPAARRIAMEYSNGLHYITPRRKNWIPKVMMLSSRTGMGIEDFWNKAKEFHKIAVESGDLQLARRRQLKVTDPTMTQYCIFSISTDTCSNSTWMWGYLNEGVMESFKNHPVVRNDLPRLENMVINCEISPGEAAEVLMSKFLERK